MEFKPRTKKSAHDFHLNCKPYKEHKYKDHIGLQALRQAVLESCKLRPSNIDRHRGRSLRSRLVKRPDKFVEAKEDSLNQKKGQKQQPTHRQNSKFQGGQYQTDFVSFSNSGSGGHESQTELNEVKDTSFKEYTTKNRDLFNSDGVENISNPSVKDEARDMKAVHVDHHLPLQEALQAAPTAAHANRRIMHFCGDSDSLHRERHYEDKYNFVLNQQRVENESLVNGRTSKLRREQDDFIDSEKVMKQINFMNTKALTTHDEDEDTIDHNKIVRPVSSNRSMRQDSKTESTSHICHEGKENLGRTANKSRNKEVPLLFSKKRDHDVKKRNDSWRKGQDRYDNLTEDDTDFPRRIGGNALDELLIMNQEISPLARTMKVRHTSAGQPHHPSEFKGDRSMHKATDSDDNFPRPDAHEQLSAVSGPFILNCPNAFSTASMMQKLDEIEHENFDLATAFRVAKSKGITLSKEDKEQLKIAMQVAEEAEEKSKEFTKEKVGTRSTKMRYNIPLLKISDPRAHTGPFFCPTSRRARNYQLQNKDLHTIQPALLDLWDSKERCPQVSSSTSVGCRMPSITIKTDGNEQQHTVTDREAICRAVTNTQALYDSCLYKPDMDFECLCLCRE